MMMHAYAPSKCPAPELYCQYTWVREIGVHWDDIGGLDMEDIPHLAQLITIKAEADALKARVARGKG